MQQPQNQRCLVGVDCATAQIVQRLTSIVLALAQHVQQPVEYSNGYEMDREKDCYDMLLIEGA